MPERHEERHLRPAEALSGLNGDFRQEVLEQLAVQALRSGGNAHDINNPSASVTANLSFLELRADDMSRQLEKIDDHAVRAQLEEIHQDLLQVVNECSTSMKRITQTARNLSKPQLVRGETGPSDLSDCARRASRLIGQCTSAEVHLEWRGEHTPVLAPEGDATILTLDLLLCATEQGHSSGDPVRVVAMTGPVDGLAQLAVMRDGPTGSAPSRDQELHRAYQIARTYSGTVEVNMRDDGYDIILRLPLA